MVVLWWFWPCWLVWRATCSRSCIPRCDKDGWCDVSAMDAKNIREADKGDIFGGRMVWKRYKKLGWELGKWEWKSGIN